MLDVAAYMALVITTTGLPLGVWTRIHLPARRCGDRQLLNLIRHDRRTAR